LYKDKIIRDNPPPIDLTCLTNVAGDKNCPMVEDRWAMSQSTRSAQAITLLSRKSCTLTNIYNFWSSGKRLIQQLASKPRS